MKNNNKINRALEDLKNKGLSENDRKRTVDEILEEQIDLEISKREGLSEYIANQFKSISALRVTG